jgi:8-oxo-dGTP pyrophosphatase MutT (NUDIX family)
VRHHVPPALLENARAYGGQPASPRDAVTVAVVRAGSTCSELLLLRRRSELAFAPSFDVFPGGKVEHHDRRPIPWAGPEPARWARRFGCDAGLAHALVVAAVRETFEETGILIASDEDGNMVRFEDNELETYRVALEHGEMLLADLLRDRRLVLRSDLLAPWSHWVTPEFEPLRYDTHFLVALAPSEASPVMAPEAKSAQWIALDRVTSAIAAGDVTMLPPTRTTCDELSEHPTDQLLNAAWARRSTLRTAVLVKQGEEYFLETEIREEHPPSSVSE